MGDKMKIVAIDKDGTQYELPKPRAIPKWIAKERKARGWSLQAVAEKVEVRRQAVWSWEQGTSLPTIENISKLIEAFGGKGRGDKRSAHLKKAEDILQV